MLNQLQMESKENDESFREKLRYAINSGSSYAERVTITLILIMMIICHHLLY